jgi:hypothetical protein
MEWTGTLEACVKLISRSDLVLSSEEYCFNTVRRAHFRHFLLKVRDTALDTDCSITLFADRLESLMERWGWFSSRVPETNMFIAIEEDEVVLLERLAADIRKHASDLGTSSVDAVEPMPTAHATEVDQASHVALEVGPPDSILCNASTESPEELSAGDGSTTGGDERPGWNRDARLLTYGECEVARFTREAENCFLLLDAFQRSGWLRWIADPFSDKGKLDDTIKYLNKRVAPAKLIKFSPQNRGVAWSPFGADS